MRLWSIHPKYLDSKGLVALWREGLLAKKVLEGGTKGYRNHPQLDRFRRHGKPVDTIRRYLGCVLDEAKSRGYRFDGTKIGQFAETEQIEVTKGQIGYEFDHLLKKLMTRDPEHYTELKDIHDVDPHPLFRIVDGDVEDWERT